MPARNDPCPCGSGLKYKKCCADIDARRDRALRLMEPGPSTQGHRAMESASVAANAAMRTALRTAARAAEWQADAMPLSITFADSPDVRPVTVLVVADDMVLDADMMSMRAAEPEDVARIIADRVGTAAWSTGSWPRALRVRYASVAPALSKALAPHDVEIIVRQDLPELDLAARALSAHMAAEPSAEAGSMPRPMASLPDRWAAWGLPSDVVERIFAAAARFHDAAPWTNLFDTETLHLLTPDRERWTACVLGNAGQEFGLALYSELSDFIATTGAAGEAEFRVPDLQGSVVTLDFETRASLPRGMHREIKSARWPLPAADAYPHLWCLNTPAGGITRAMANTLALALDAVSRFATEHAAILERHPHPDPPLTWNDVDTGVVVFYAGDLLDAVPELVMALAPGAATGPGADPDAIAAGGDIDALLARERAVVVEFEQWLLSGGPGRRRVGAGTARLHTMIVEAFVDCVVGHHGATLRAVHEYDLRVFLYDWFPRMIIMSRSDAMRAPVSLGRFFDFLAETREIECPWAWPILDDREMYADRLDECPGEFWWDRDAREWRAELGYDLVARALIPVDDLAGVGQWGDTMGPEETMLHEELCRRWLRWRDEIIEGGITDPADAVRILASRQSQWETSGHPQHAGRSPSDVVRRERAAPQLPHAESP